MLFLFLYAVFSFISSNQKFSLKQCLGNRHKVTDLYLSFLQIETQNTILLAMVDYPSQC